MPDGSVFAAGIDRLQNDEQSIAPVGIKQLLKPTQAVQSLLERIVVALYSERVVRVAIFQAQLAAWLDDATFCEVHTSSFSSLRLITSNRALGRMGVPVAESRVYLANISWSLGLAMHRRSGPLAGFTQRNWCASALGRSRFIGITAMTHFQIDIPDLFGTAIHRRETDY